MNTIKQQQLLGALKTLDDIVASVNLTRSQHIRCQSCSQMIKEHIENSEVTSDEDKTPVPVRNGGAGGVRDTRPAEAKP